MRRAPLYHGTRSARRAAELLANNVDIPTTDGFGTDCYLTPASYRRRRRKWIERSHRLAQKRCEDTLRKDTNRGPSTMEWLAPQ